MTDPENGVTNYSYDALNRLTNLEDFQGHNFGFTYDALENVGTKMWRQTGGWPIQSLSLRLSGVENAVRGSSRSSQ